MFFQSALNFINKGVLRIINIEKYPQYELYQTILVLYDNIEKLNNFCSKWSIYNILITKAYYSSYHLSILWLEDNPNVNFVIKKREDFKVNERFRTEHQQVQDALIDCGQFKISNDLRSLHKLRKNADYSIYNEITDNDLESAIKYMDYIFSILVKDIMSF